MRLMRSFLWMSAGLLAALNFLGWQLTVRGGSFLQFAGIVCGAIALLIIVGVRVVKPLSNALQRLADQLAEPQLSSDLKTKGESDLNALRACMSLLKTSGLKVVELESEKSKLVEALKQASELDPLTQLLNRRSVQQRSQQLLSYAKRNKGKVALIMLKLDHFKEVNNRHGYAVGDMVLTNLAQVFKEECRGADLLARTGDEEFLILGLDCDAEQAKAFAERLRERIHRSKFSAVNGQKFRLTASFGVACAFAGELDSFEVIFAEADRALHVARLEGRNRVVLSLLEPTTQNFMRQKADIKPMRPIPDRLDALAV
jgi:diguanylate cyclase (GGDEF)-like protein